MRARMNEYNEQHEGQIKAWNITKKSLSETASKRGKKKRGVDWRKKKEETEEIKGRIGV